MTCSTGPEPRVPSYQHNSHQHRSNNRYGLIKSSLRATSSTQTALPISHDIPSRKLEALKMKGNLSSSSPIRIFVLKTCTYGTCEEEGLLTFWESCSFVHLSRQKFKILLIKRAIISRFNTDALITIDLSTKRYKSTSTYHAAQISLYYLYVDALVLLLLLR